MKIKNKNYREFLEKGVITILTSEHLARALNQVTGIRGNYVKEGRALVIGLYYTGARPAELLEMECKDVEKEGNYISMDLKTLKRGLARKVYVSQQRLGMKEFYKYSKSNFPNYKMFFHYKRDYLKSVKLPSGEIKQYTETSYAVRYYINKWFKGVVNNDTIPPYFLRHNRISSAAEKGATLQELKYLKGARDIKSVNPYLHLDKTKAKKLAKKIF